ncbi:conjugal transfer protein TrbH [Bosea sp. MMO-172]|uniref:conjugal transfer protein TrbH n=1 Tax=Bosea sp. MMO-172 TaxID=3127885 RepID=UPI0030173562
MTYPLLPTLRPARSGALVLAAAFLSGCSTFGSGGLVDSTAPAELSAPAASAVAGDLVPRLAEQIGQGKVTVLLKSDGSAFGTALETSLRGWGYTVKTDQETKDPKAIQLAYVLASADGQVLARLSTGSIEIGRIYSATATGAQPASPVSVMKRG